MTNRIGSDRRLLSDRRYCGVESSGQPTPFHGLGMLHVFALVSISGNDITPVIYLDWLESLFASQDQTQSGFIAPENWHSPIREVPLPSQSVPEG